ncbi:branched-chain amino acid aminotransferase [Clostridium algifaecis]|uniref:Branched-chain amino acid aminotransferase n=1 Tax=Clostridium algifaecis TaxID=1472040 RepID=A0ABS4KT70_9CLOT|nr:aminotransferase class IV [Clostridium algifaecis]MBP2033233.1 branched-chain amino acid aminotransferase [Clostridium algifaecis]
MDKCTNEFFMLNDDIKHSHEFNDKEIKTGRSLYEVIRIIDAKPLFLEKHMARMKNSAKVANLKLWLSIEKVKKNILKLIEVNNINIGNIKIVFNFNDENNFFAYFIEHHYPDTEDYKNGVDTILYSAERENPNAKIINVDFRKLVDIRIKKKNVYEAILVDKKGYITEGSRSNVFFVKGDRLITAPLEQVLPGTTRQVILEICGEMNINVIEKKINHNDIDEFDALFICGTSPKVLPVKLVDNFQFRSSQNKIVNEIMKNYDIKVENNIKNLIL